MSWLPLLDSRLLPAHPFWTVAGGACQPEAFRFDSMKAMDGSALRGLLPASSLLN